MTSSAHSVCVMNLGAPAFSLSLSPFSLLSLSLYNAYICITYMYIFIICIKFFYHLDEYFLLSICGCLLYLFWVPWFGIYFIRYWNSWASLYLISYVFDRLSSSFVCLSGDFFFFASELWFLEIANNWILFFKYFLIDILRISYHALGRGELVLVFWLYLRVLRHYGHSLSFPPFVNVIHLRFSLFCLVESVDSGCFSTVFVFDSKVLISRISVHLVSSQTLIVLLAFFPLFLPF